MARTLGETDVKDLTTDDVNRFGAAFNAYKPPAPAPAPPVPSPAVPATINRTVDPDPNVAAAENFQNTFTQPETREQIIERRRKEAAALVESTNKVFDDEVAASQERGTERLNQRNAISIMSGLMGSTPAVDAKNRVTDANAKEVQAINNRRALEIAKIYGDISAAADKEAREQLEDARRSADEIVARQKTSQEEAVKKIQLMAAAGLVDYETFKGDARNKKVYDYALGALGGSDEALKATFALSRPQETVLSSQWQGSKLFQVYRHPVTGAFRTEIVDLGALGYEVPPDYSEKLDLGNEWYLFSKDNPEEGYRIPKAPNEEDALRKRSLQLDVQKKERDLADPTGGGQLYSGLSAPTATAVRARVSKFAGEPVIQNFATVQDGYNFAASIDTKTKNPADDQALIYSLAKALDPGSVVREGEYATAQKYAQSWVAAHGKGVSQALAGTGFLSETARENIKKVIEQKYTSSKKSYDNLYKEYAEGINKLTGRADGDAFLTDYATSSSAPADAKTAVVEFAKQSSENRQIVETLLQQYPDYTYDDLLQIINN